MPASHGVGFALSGDSKGIARTNLCMIMILPKSAGDYTGLCHRGPSTHLACQTEGVVGFKVRLDRAGIVLFYVSSPLVLYNCKTYMLVAVSARAFGPLTFLKRDFLLRGVGEKISSQEDG